MFPDIISIADQFQLIIKRNTRSKPEVLAKCPFCQEDSKPGKERRFYLSINADKKVFKCWSCGEGGGVIRFISLLEGVTEDEVSSRFRNPRRLLHPAERLSRAQKKLMGIEREPDWQAMQQRDRAYYYRTLDCIWERWKAFLSIELREAYSLVVMSIAFREDSYLNEIAAREKVVQAKLLSPALQIFERAERPGWALQIEKSIFAYIAANDKALSTSA